MINDLPEPAIIDRHIPTNTVIRGYTADQMREYGAACAAHARELALEQADNREWIAGVAEGKRIVRKLAEQAK